MKKLISSTLALAMLFTMLGTLIITPAKAEIADISLGDYVQMGSYYGEPIIWRCVGFDTNGPLMLSDKILTIKPFDAKGDHTYLDGTPQADSSNGRTNIGSNIWETSNLRNWLNSSAAAGDIDWTDGCPPSDDNVSDLNGYSEESGFLSNDNFALDEINAIKSVSQKAQLLSLDAGKLSVGGSEERVYYSGISDVIQNYDNTYYHNVTDKMFVLDSKQLYSVYQNRATLGDNYYIGKPTQSAVDNSNTTVVTFDSTSYCSNWLRDPYAKSDSPYSVYCVYSDGTIIADGAMASYYGVRPAFYLDMENAIFVDGVGTEAEPYLASSEVIATASPTVEPTITPTEEVTIEPTEEPTAQPTDEATPTVEPTAAATETATPTPTPTPTATPICNTPTPTIGATATASATVTPTATATATPTATASATVKPTTTAAPKATATLTARPTTTATINPTTKPTATITVAPAKLNSPTIAKITDKEKIISGKSVSGGTVSIVIGKKTYTSKVSNANTWSLKLNKSLSIGTKVVVSVKKGNISSDKKTAYVLPSAPGVYNFNSKSIALRGYTYPNAKVSIKVNGKWKTTMSNTKGLYSLKLAKPLKKVTAVLFKVTYKGKVSPTKLVYRDAN